jgi:hypothetical protein
MAHHETTTHKKVVFKSLKVLKRMRWLLERPLEAHWEECRVLPEDPQMDALNFLLPQRSSLLSEADSTPV